MAKKTKKSAGYIGKRSNNVGKTSIDFSPMRERIDGLKKLVHTLPESKTTTAVMKELEALYLWAGGYFPGFVANEVGITGAGVTVATA